MSISSRNMRTGVTLPRSLYRLARQEARDAGLTWSEWCARLVESEVEARVGAVTMRKVGAYLARFERATEPARDTVQKRC